MIPFMLTWTYLTNSFYRVLSIFIINHIKSLDRHTHACTEDSPGEKTRQRKREDSMGDGSQKALLVSLVEFQFFQKNMFMHCVINVNYLKSKNHPSGIGLIKYLWKILFIDIWRREDLIIYVQEEISVGRQSWPIVKSLTG